MPWHGDEESRRQARQHAEGRRRLARRLQAQGEPPEHIDAVLAKVAERQRRRRQADAVQRAAWRLRHPGLSEATIRLVVAELRRHHRTGAA